jgi:hypothetical protein
MWKKCAVLTYPLQVPKYFEVMQKFYVRILDEHERINLKI